jgi:hypothetical protein
MDDTREVRRLFRAACALRRPDGRHWLSDRGLAALAAALEGDAADLLQGATIDPPPLRVVRDWPPEAACLLAYPAWKDGLKTVGEVAEAFAQLCFALDEHAGEPAACRHVLNAWDELPRWEARALFLGEVRRAIKVRDRVARVMIAEK